MEHRLVTRGPRIEAAADILDCFGKRAGVAAARSLEHHMLDEVGDAREMLGFGARTDAGVDAQRNRLRARQRIDGDRQAIGKNVLLAAHRASPFIRLRRARP